MGQQGSSCHQGAIQCHDALVTAAKVNFHKLLDNVMDDGVVYNMTETRNTMMKSSSKRSQKRHRGYQGYQLQGYKDQQHISQRRRSLCEGNHGLYGRRFAGRSLNVDLTCVEPYRHRPSATRVHSTAPSRR